MSLLVRLRSYCPRDGLDPLENYITEGFSWLLEQPGDFGARFCSLIASQLKPELCNELTNASNEALTWTTQFTLGTLRPDMVALGRNVILIFEHKVKSPFSEAQITRYRDLAQIEYPNHKAVIISITAMSNRPSHNADLHLSWQQIYTFVAAYQADYEGEHQALFRSFNDLLAHEGQAPAAPVSFEALQHYPVASLLPVQINNLFASIQGRNPNWGLPDHIGTFQGKRWGRIGIECCRINGAIPWSPGVFIGCVIDGYDHGVSHRISKEVKLQIIVDFGAELYHHYRAFRQFGEFVENLHERSKFSDWTFYNHLEERRDVNRYHPLYLERPLFEVLRGATDAADQQDRVIATVQEGVRVLAASGLSEVMKACDMHLTGRIVT